MNINEIYEKYENYIRRTIYSIINKQHNGFFPSITPEIEDVESEVWLLITKQIQNFNIQKSSLKTFLVLITKSEINMLYKKDCNYKNLGMKTCLSIDTPDDTEVCCNLLDILSNDEDLYSNIESEYLMQDIFNCLDAEETKYLTLHIVQRVPLKELNILMGWNISDNSLNTKSSRILKKIRLKVINGLQKTIDF